MRRAQPGNRTSLQVAGSIVCRPGVTMAAAKPELDMTSNLDKLFAVVKEGDPILEAIYFGMKSGVYWQYPPEHANPSNSVQFTLDPSLAQQLNQGGEIPEPLRSALKENGIVLSPHTVVSTTEPGNHWVMQDDESKRIFSVRQGKTGLDVQEEYDPTIRPWYLSAVARKGPVWTKYPDWDLLGTGGKLVFAIGKDFDGQITDKVSPGLAAAFRSRQVSLGVNSPISMEQAGRWIIQDENGNHYEIRKENGKLNVYRIDVLTCSQAVFDPEGRLAGVVGLDISMEFVGSKGYPHP